MVKQRHIKLFGDLPDSAGDAHIELAWRWVAPGLIMNEQEADGVHRRALPKDLGNANLHTVNRAAAEAYDVTDCEISIQIDSEQDFTRGIGKISANEVEHGGPAGQALAANLADLSDPALFVVGRKDQSASGTMSVAARG